MSGKGSGPVSTFSTGDVPLLDFLVCVGFFKLLFFCRQLLYFHSSCAQALH